MTFVLADGTVIDTAAPGRGARPSPRPPPSSPRGCCRSATSCCADDELRGARRRQVRDQEHDRLPPVRVPRRRRPRWRSSGGCVDRLGGNARVPRRGRVRDASRCSPARRSSLAATSRTSTRPSEVVPALVAAGASATELMVAPTLIAAAWNMPGTPEAWKELPARVRRAAGRVPRRPRATSSTNPRRRRCDPGRRARLLEAAPLHPRAGARSACCGTSARGCRACLAAMRAAGRAADHRGRVRAPRARRRGGQGPAGAARPPRLPAGRRRPRLRRQPALPADAELRRAGRPRALRRLHARAGRADRRTPTTAP